MGRGKGTLEPFDFDEVLRSSSGDFLLEPIIKSLPPEDPYRETYIKTKTQGNIQARVSRYRDDDSLHTFAIDLPSITDKGGTWYTRVHEGDNPKTIVFSDLTKGRGFVLREDWPDDAEPPTFHVGDLERAVRQVKTLDIGVDWSMFDHFHQNQSYFLPVKGKKMGLLKTERRIVFLPGTTLDLILPLKASDYHFTFSLEDLDSLCKIVREIFSGQ
jgi:hypothetical protein